MKRASPRSAARNSRIVEVRVVEDFHDRFLVIDDDSYHFGASFKDLGRRTFMFSKIEEPFILEALMERIQTAWEIGLVVS